MINENICLAHSCVRACSLKKEKKRKKKKGKKEKKKNQEVLKAPRAWV